MKRGINQNVVTGGVGKFKDIVRGPPIQRRLGSALALRRERLTSAPQCGHKNPLGVHSNNRRLCRPIQAHQHDRRYMYAVNEKYPRGKRLGWRNLRTYFLRCKPQKQANEFILSNTKSKFTHWHQRLPPKHTCTCAYNIIKYIGLQGYVIASAAIHITFTNLEGRRPAVRAPAEDRSILMLIKVVGPT